MPARSHAALRQVGQLGCWLHYVREEKFYIPFGGVNPVAEKERVAELQAGRPTHLTAMADWQSWSSKLDSWTADAQLGRGVA